MVLVGFAFVAGIVTIASPCILPLLPIVLSGSAGEGRLRPYAIVAGFILCFSAATLGFSLLVQATGVSTNALRWAAVAVLAALGIVMLVPRLSGWFEVLASRLTARGSGPQQKREGLGGGLLVGASLGLVWTPCVGPIMASVITLAAAGSVSGATVGITVAYALGTAIPMFLIIVGGRKILDRVKARRAAPIIQRVFAGLMIVVAVGIAFNVDRRFQGWVLDTFPGYAGGITAIEERAVVDDELERLQGE